MSELERNIKDFTLKTDLMSKNLQLSNLTRAYEDLSTSYAWLVDQNGKLLSWYEYLTKEVNEKQNSFEMVTEEKKKLEAENESLKQCIKMVSDNRLEFMAESKALRERVAELEAENESLKQCIEMVSDNRLEFIAESKALRERVAELEAELQNYRD